MLVRDIMKSPVDVADAECTLAAAYELMRERGIRHLPVTRGGKLAGIVTDRDLRLATSALAAKPFPAGARLAEVMSSPVQTADPLDPVEDAARTMRQLKIGCLPVTAGDEVAGIVTGIDLLDALLRLTGVFKPSGRLEVAFPDRPGELARLVSFLAAKRIDIRSVLSHPDPGDKVRLVLRLGTIDVKLVAHDLRGEGFEVVWPAQAPW